MFLFPSGLMLHAKLSILDYFIWNEIPTVLGNLVGGLAFTGLTLYTTHVMTAPKRSEVKILTRRAGLWLSARVESSQCQNPPFSTARTVAAVPIFGWLA